MLSSQEFIAYLEQNGGLYSLPNVILLKSGNISNFYVDQRFFAREETKHKGMLLRIGLVIDYEARRLGADTIIGLLTVGAAFAEYTEAATDIKSGFINPHDENSRPDFDIRGKKVLIVDGTCSTGSSIKEAVKICENHGATIMGAFVTFCCNPVVNAKTVGLHDENQEFIALAKSDFPSVTEKPDENSLLLQGCDLGSYQVRLDVGYAAEMSWPAKYPNFIFVGEPKLKT